MKFIFSFLLCTSAFAQETLPMGGRRTAQEVQVVGAKLDETMKITFHVMKPLGDTHMPNIHFQVPDCAHKCLLVFDIITFVDGQEKPMTTLGIRSDKSMGPAISGENGIVKTDPIGKAPNTSMCWKNFRICSEYKATTCRPLDPEYYYEWSTKTGDAFTNIPRKPKELMPTQKGAAQLCGPKAMS